MNGYIAFYNGKQYKVYAESLYGAKQKALEYFKPPKSKQHMVHVHLAEKNMEPITHLAAD